ncbi:MAG TPA: hypothetical protein VLX92_21470 [Kofleriaceae bacterium]|nr:hypothetical protein [Kofleriaceae bacterium]
MKRALVVVAVVAIGCKDKPAAEPVPAPQAQAGGSAAAGLASLRTLPAIDLVGYLSGNYHTASNNPAMYADLDRKVFVMMGKHGKAEVPLDKPDDATTAFESFLVLHGYAADGRPPTDDHQKVMVDGKEMVVVTTDELFPEMPADLRAHFSDAQNDALYHTRPHDGYALLAEKEPVVWAYTATLEVLAPGVARQFPVEKASDAMALFRSLVKPR